jgi:hypothetical protein
MRRLLVIFFLAPMCASALAATGPTVTKTYVDNKKTVHIVTSDGRDRAVPREKEQEEAEKLQVAPDGKTVGWLVYSSTCCVSYPVPLELIVWRSGKVIRRVNPSMAIWSWVFLKNGGQLAFRNSPLHGGWSGESVLIEIASGKTLASWDHPTDENGNDTDDDSDEPAWAKELK